MALSYTETLINNRLDEITALVDAGAAAGHLKIYSGSVPADVGTALSAQVLLADITLADPSAAAAASGVLTLDFDPDVADSSADATGTASFFRITDSDGNAVVQGTVGTSGADLNLTSVSIVATESVTLSTAAITGGNA